LAVLAATTLAFAVGLAWLQGTEIFTVTGLLNAVVCGLTFWLFVAIFHLRTDTVAVEVTDGPTFLRRLRADLMEMGYHPTRLGAWTYVFTPDFTALRFGGRVRAHASAGVARVTAPKGLLERLRGPLRLHAFAASARAASDVARKRRGRHLLRRVHISFRVGEGEGPAVPAEVVQALAEEGAEVTCDINILAHSPGGIRESVIEGLVRDRFRPHHIAADVRTEPMTSWVLEAAEAAR
jgi:hypothetical protein